MTYLTCSKRQSYSNRWSRYNSNKFKSRLSNVIYIKCYRIYIMYKRLRDDIGSSQYGIIVIRNIQPVNHSLDFTNNICHLCIRVRPLVCLFASQSCTGFLMRSSSNYLNQNKNVKPMRVCGWLYGWFWINWLPWTILMQLFFMETFGNKFFALLGCFFLVS